ncbi:hypothetical protein NE237_001517 [Protea cynaroides]|uniref:BZIP domain-containing protein n=1 Tax=Protea cynaroides TaxID=273540 RepID=A0A9Q0KU48_9MAGN|nr:hypothetical protein NE237_001517 [Protea cynaroides]
MMEWEMVSFVGFRGINVPVRNGGGGGDGDRRGESGGGEAGGGDGGGGGGGVGGGGGGEKTGSGGDKIGNGGGVANSQVQMAKRNNMVTDILWQNRNPSNSSTFMNIKLLTEMNMENGDRAKKVKSNGKMNLKLSRNVSSSSVDDNSEGTESSYLSLDKSPSLDGGVATSLDPYQNIENIVYQHKWHRQIDDPKIDPQKLKRILSNRRSAKKCRDRKLEYTKTLEAKMNALQADVSLMNSQISYLKSTRLQLITENSIMKQRIATFISEKQFRDDQTTMLIEERDRLQDLLKLQQQQLQPSFEESVDLQLKL